MNKPLLITLFLTSTLGLSAFASAQGNSSAMPQRGLAAMTESVRAPSTTPADHLQVTAFSQRERPAMDLLPAATNAAPVTHANVIPFSPLARPAMDADA